MTTDDHEFWPLRYVVGLLVALAVVELRWAMIGKNLWVDIDVYIQGGRAILDGQPLYDISIHGLPFTYSPFAAVAFVPLAAVPTRVARYLLTAASVAAYFGVAAIVSRRLGIRLRQALPVVVLGLALEPFFQTIRLGQINLVLMLGVIVDCLVLTRRRGWLVGIAAGIKLTPGVFVVYFVLKRDWAAVRGAVLGFLATVVVGALLAPSASWSYWTGGFATLSKWGGAVIRADNQSLYGAMLRASAPLNAPPMSSMLLVLAGVAFGGWAARRALRAGEEVAALLAVAIGGLLASPITWTHHWVWILPALLVLLARRQWAWAILFGALFVIAPMWHLVPPMSQTTSTQQQVLILGPGARLVSMAYVLAGMLWLVIVSRPAPAKAGTLLAAARRRARPARPEPASLASAARRGVTAPTSTPRPATPAPS